jgi:hypothetical protein
MATSGSQYRWLRVDNRWAIWSTPTSRFIDQEGRPNSACAARPRLERIDLLRRVRGTDVVDLGSLVICLVPEIPPSHLVPATRLRADPVRTDASVDDATGGACAMPRIVQSN